MLRQAFVLTSCLACLLLLTACARKDINNAESVRSAVLAHIEARGDLNVADLEITVENTNFEGDRCEATVSFAPKGTDAAGSMTMNYTLLRDGDEWKVQPKSPSGGGMQSPMGGEAPPPAAPGALPPGHPPVAPQPNSGN